jgi:gamma-glutamylcysteine synthetase
MVKLDGTAADQHSLHALWEYLEQNGWDRIVDRVTGTLAGTRIAGPMNDTVASCETGYCKPEFSLAHVANLFELNESIDALRELLNPFLQKHGVRLLGYGIQPVTPPSGYLLFKKERSCFWDRAVPSNWLIPPEQGDDVHLFTVNAGSHVHVSVDLEDAVDTVNVLNGLAGAQIALTANSPVWRGKADNRYVCVNEKLWDWWRPAAARSGVPERAFVDLEDYIRTIENLTPIYVKRNGQPVLLPQFQTFGEYFASGETIGHMLDGRTIPLTPRTEDIRTHNSCYWYTARISQYYTVENRVFDQQPPADLICAAALTLGLISALDEAQSIVSHRSWAELRQAREVACQQGLRGSTEELSLAKLASQMLEVAQLGLTRRGLGEEIFLQPLEQRLQTKTCPAERAIRIFEQNGIEGLVEQLAL